MRLTFGASLLAAIGLTLSTVADAALVYIGATGGASGNTINLTTVSPANETDWYNGADDGSNDARVNDDNLWGAIGPQGFATFDPALTAVWESGGLEDAPELQTTVSGLASETYDVYVLYSTATGVANGWDISAGLNGGAKTGYTDLGTIDSEIGPYDLRRVLLGQVTGTSFTVEVDDLPGGDRSRYVGVAYEEATILTPDWGATIDRDTGALSIVNDGFASGSIIGYSFTSGIGALDEAGWDSIAEIGDSDSGGSIDPDDQWTGLTAAGVHSDLSEAQLVAGAGAGDGAIVLPSGAIDLGNAWIKHPSEEVEFKLLLSDGTTLDITPIFTGNGGEAYSEGDLDFSGGATPLTAADWIIQRDNWETDLSSLSIAEAYAKGDLDGDLDNDWDDFDRFKQLYDAANGFGAFAAMVSRVSVPEPSSALLMACGLACCFVRRKYGMLNLTKVPHLLLIVAAMALITASTRVANAQITYVGATAGPSGNTINLNSGNDSDWITVGAALDGSGDTRDNDDLWGAIGAQGFSSFDASLTAVWESGAVEDAPELQTAVDGLAAGLYDVYVLYSTATGVANNWDIAAGLNGGAKAGYRDFGDIDSEIGPYDLRRVLLGQVNGTSFTVEVDEFAGGDRSRYVGVAYQPFFALDLEVNTSTGEVALANNNGVSVEIDGYEISSTGGLLQLGNWNSLEDQDYEGSGGPDDGMGFEELGVPSGGLLAEAILTSTYTFDPGESVSLGHLFDTGSSLSDLGLRFREPTGLLRDGFVVQDSTTPVPGDYNGDGVVNLADYTVWRDNLGANDESAFAPDTGNGGGIDSTDYTSWKSIFGETSGSGSLVAAEVPEPMSSTTLMLACGLALSFCVRRMPKESAYCQSRTPSPRRVSLCVAMLAIVAWAELGSTAQAAVTNDRFYQLGDDSQEDAANSPGNVVGDGPSNVAPGQTLDSGELGDPSGSFIDLSPTGEPLYVDVSTLGTGRSGIGVLFDGTDDALSGISLGLPDGLALRVDLTDGIEDGVPAYPLNYTGILGHGSQGWVYPDAAALGSSGSPTTFQSIVFDRLRTGGPAINEVGQWTQVNGTRTDGITSPFNPVPATVDVPVGNTWYHFMHHNTSDPLIGDDDRFISVLYIDGIAVSANIGDINNSNVANAVNELIIGAGEVANDGITTDYTFHFTGAIDDVEMYVYGDNTSEGGQDYGTFDLFADNEWIAAEIVATVPGGVLQPGDVNKDGMVSGDGTGPVGSDDVSAFIAGWLSENILPGPPVGADFLARGDVAVGDWNTWDDGDMNHDGTTDLADAFILHEALLAAGAGGLNFELLTGGLNVPEPTSVALVGFTTVTLLVGHLLQRRC